jgi:phage-related protein
MADWELIFYETTTGRMPVRQFLDDLPGSEAARMTKELQLLQRFGTALTMPHVRPVTGTDLRELRSRGRLQQRVLYVAISGRRFLLLHAFTKKTATTSEREIRLALDRLEDHRRRQQP